MPEGDPAARGRSRRTPEGDPSANGHRRIRRPLEEIPQPSPPPASGRGRWLVVVGVVSASTGLFLLAGGMIGAVLGGPRDLGGLGLGVGPLMVGVAGGGVLGVWLGAWASARLTADAGRRSLMIRYGVGGTVGMVVSVIVLGTVGRTIPGIAPLLAVLSPGAGALAADALLPQRPARGG